jgi:hypothetical protein
MVAQIIQVPAQFKVLPKLYSASETEICGIYCTNWFSNKLRITYLKLSLLWQHLLFQWACKSNFPFTTRIQVSR